MRTHLQPLDEDSAARLVQGLVHPDDAPPGYGPVAQLLSSAARLPRLPVDEDEAAGTVLAMVETIRDAALAPAPQASRRRPMIAKLLAGKALAAVAVVGLTATGAAAAAKGSLPEPVQSVVSDAVGTVGVKVPHPNHGKSAGHRKDAEKGHKGHKGQPDAGGDKVQPVDTPKPENNGQVTSDAAHTAKDAAKAAGEKVGPAVCAAVTDGKCQAGADHGQKPAGETPPKSGPAENQGKGPKPGEGEGGKGKKPETPAGSIATGEEHSKRDLPSGKGKPSSDN